MVKQAVKKLQDEIEKNKANPAIKAMGEFLIGHIQSNPSNAEKILAVSKTIDGAMNFMKEKARKKQKNGYAIIAPQEGFNSVAEYYGIKSVTKTAESVTKQAQHVPESPETVHKTVKAAFDIDLDDLL